MGTSTSSGEGWFNERRKSGFWLSEREIIEILQARLKDLQNKKKEEEEKRAKTK
jgi:hypothetical protein